MGLHPRLHPSAFERFMQLPLYEDMAPWNIVLMGPRLDYIDYDTREVTFDKVVSAYLTFRLAFNPAFAGRVTSVPSDVCSSEL
jgi:hypothetical protein